MITKKVVETFITSDGQEFASEIEALVYENHEFLMYQVFGTLGNAASHKTRHQAAMLVLKNLPKIVEHFVKQGYINVPVADTVSIGLNDERAPVAVPEVMKEEETAPGALDGKVTEMLDKFKDEPGARIKVKKKYKTNPPMPFPKEDILATMTAIKEASGVGVRDDIVEVLKERKLVIETDGVLKLTTGGHGSMNGLRRMREPKAA